MLKTRSAQVGLFDAAMVMGPLPEGSFFALLAEHGDRIVRDEDFADCYSERMGRPSIPPSQLAKVLLLQHRTGVSDEQAMECVGWDLRWKVALGLPIDHHGWHPTTLTKFRARLLLHKKDGVALENSLRLAAELGMLDGPMEQIVDSTPMLGAAATQDTVRLVRFGVRKLIDAVTAADPEAGETLAAGLEFDYAQPGVKPECQWRLKAERQRMLTRVATDAQRALLAVEQTDGLLDVEPVKEAWELLGELIGQDFDVDQDGVPTLHRGTKPGRVISVIDPEMQHGRKSSQSRFDGYKLSAAVSNSTVPLIMAVHVAPGGESDGPQAKHLIDAQPAERRPGRILGDTAYGNGVGALRVGRTGGAGARPGPGRQGGREPGRQAGVHDRSGRRDGHLPGRAHRADHHLQDGCADRADRTRGVRRLSPEGALLSRTSQPADRARRARRAADRRSRSAQRPGHREASAAYPPQDRTATRAARVPLRRA